MNQQENLNWKVHESHRARIRHHLRRRDLAGLWAFYRWCLWLRIYFNVICRIPWLRRAWRRRRGYAD